jgi:DNA modification methylase
VKSFHDGKITLHSGDCLDVVKAMPENSIDAVVTDPPYGIKFMGREWDHSANIAFHPELWAGVLRVLKPGGHMVAFSGTRTYHRMVCAIEDAGFEIRDQLAWVYGSGFPKSHDVSKGIDRAAGANRTERITPKAGHENFVGRDNVRSLRESGVHSGEGGFSRPWMHDPLKVEDAHWQFAPATYAARQWQGYGTALKPSWEPICLVRKPLSESTVAANVLRWGTGALNIDGCRIGIAEQERSVIDARSGAGFGTIQCEHAGREKGEKFKSHSAGRWPANLCHDGSPEVLAGFPETTSGNLQTHHRLAESENGSMSGKNYARSPRQDMGGDSGSAARFFYTAKADGDDRLGSRHPTVKPVDLMQWLVRLICPKGATVLDPFSGTGTTGAASFIEGRRCVLIEREAEYLADIEKRIGMLLSGSEERSWKLAKPEPLEALPLFALPDPAE